MRLFKFSLLLILALFAQTQAQAAATEVAGVNFADRTKVGDSELTLNGAGIRARLIFKVYAIGLYLAEKRSGAAEAVAAPGAKRIEIVTLRDLPAEDFAKALVEGIEKNSSEAANRALSARTETLRQTMLALKMAPKGAKIQLDWLPASGTRLIFNGDKRGEDLPGEDFYQALLKIWLGDKPAAQDLKDALLGRAP